MIWRWSKTSVVHTFDCNESLSTQLVDCSWYDVTFLIFFTDGVQVVAAWYDQGLLSSLQKYKLIFIETQDSAETSLALFNYIKVQQNFNFC